MKKSLRIALLVLVLVLANINFSMAATPTLTLTTESKETVSEGETVKAVLAQTEGDLMAGIQFTLSYDSSLFELTNKETNSNWTSFTTASENEYALSNEKSTTKGSIMTFTFKALSDTTINSIKLTDVILTDANTYDDTNIGTINILGATAEPVTLTNVLITNQPSTTIYTEGANFDPTGMKITAVYSDGTQKEITDYSYSPKGALSTSDNKVTITYTENGVTKTVTLPIIVNVADTSDKDSNNNDDNNKDNSKDNNTTTDNTDNTTTQDSKGQDKTTQSDSTTKTDTTKATTTNTTSADTTTAVSSLPKTGTKALFIAGIIFLLIVAGLGYYKGYQKYRGI